MKTDWDMNSDVYSLVIKDATLDDAGDYMVKAENSKGSFNFTVSVIVGKSAPTESVESTHTVKSFCQTIVDGKVVDSSEKEEVSVGKGGLTTTSFREEGMPRSVSVEEVTDKDLGASAMEVRQTFTVEEPTSDEEFGDDADGPQIVIAPEPTVVDVGETIKLSCKVTGQRRCFFRSL